MLECVIGIIIDGVRVRVGDIIDKDHPLYEKAKKYAAPRENKGKKINTVFFTVPKKREDAFKPATISDIARSRAFNPALNNK